MRGRRLFLEREVVKPQRKGVVLSHAITVVKWVTRLLTAGRARVGLLV